MTLLDEPSGHAVRSLALAYLDEASAAAARLDQADDDEALHDFRVALRRLRSLIRAYRDHFHGSIPELFETRLRRLARRTNPAREMEVHIAWLKAQRASLPRAQHAGLDWLLKRLVDGGDDACKPARLRKRFARIERGLRDHLADRSEDALRNDGHDGGFATAFAAVLQHAGAVLDKRVAAITGEDDARALHRTRIAGKRLRYALEPMLKELPAVAGPLKTCKRMQDQLGALHDAHTLSVLLAEAVESAAAERARNRLAAALAGRRIAAPDHHAALVGLARRARDAQLDQFAAFEQEFLRGGLTRLLRQVDALAGGLKVMAPA